MNLIYSKLRENSEIEIIDNIISMKVPSNEEIKQAIKEHGVDIIETVQEAVMLSDPDTAYCIFADLDMHNHVVALEELYFA